MAKKVLITGSTGFLGSACWDHLQTQNYELFGMSRKDCDIRDEQSIIAFLGKQRPDIIIHLAGQNSVESSIANPQDTFDVNVNGTISFLHSLKEIKPLFVFMSTAAVYQASDSPITENGALNPKSPYAISKYSAELITRNLCERYSIPFIIVRGFKMIGPMQRPTAFDSKSAQQLAQCELSGEQCTISIQNPDTVVDCLDSRDAARALHELIEKGKHGETYNLCSGKGYRLIDRIDLLNGLTNNLGRIAIEPDGYSPSSFVGDHSKLTAHTGWQPRYDVLNDTLPILLNYWRSELKLKAKS